MFRRLKARIQARRQARADRPPLVERVAERVAMNWIHKLLAPVPGTIKGFINPTELFHSIATALGGGGVVGVLILVLTAISSHVASIFPNPIVASLVTVLLGLILDLLRRQNDGTVPKALSPGSVVPASGAMSPAPGSIAPATPDHAGDPDAAVAL